MARKTPSKKSRKTPSKKRTTESASVVPAKYRDRYADGWCGDALATRLKKHVAAADGTIDTVKLQQLAQANGVWSPDYKNLNAGLARMSIGNRLRKLARDGSKIAWS
jgi:hypothetical protein